MTKLLVIDDERPILEMFEISLSTEGYEVITAESGNEGLKIFSEQGPKLVITDIKMPGMDGIDVLRRIKGMDSEAEVIVITGHGDMDSAIAALQYGASDFINKPIRLDALLLALERAERQIVLNQQLRDYTENLEKKVEECSLELRQAHEELIKTERLATIGETVAGLAHSIKNILTGLHGGTYMVNTGLAKDKSDMVEAGWAMVQRNIKKISDLSLEFLRYSKERVPERTLCKPNEIVSEVVELLSGHAKQHNIRLNTFLDPDLREAYLDREGVYQVLLNLVSNAIDACLYDTDTSKSWEVTIRTARETGAESGETLLFEVADNGMGIAPEVKDKLFTRFLSTKAGRGTGLGLLITQKIVHEHGGKLDVDTKPGQGTTFSVRLKIEAPEGHPQPQQKDVTT